MLISLYGSDSFLNLLSINLLNVIAYSSSTCYALFANNMSVESYFAI
jgi:hypothetical protein